jgi:hypothetical protein
MFRRRPLLGAAVLVGSSRSAARHEVDDENERELEREQAAEMRAEQKEYQDAERDRHTKLAISEALAKEHAESGHTYKQSADITGEEKNVFCTECGQPVFQTDRFCTHCGQKHAYNNVNEVHHHHHHHQHQGEVSRTHQPRQEEQDLQPWQLNGIE